MEGRVFFIILIVLGVLSLLFQAIGFFSPAWLIFDMEVNDPDSGLKLTENVGLGLFAGHACADTGYGEQCGTFSMDTLTNAIHTSDQPDASKAAADGLVGSFLPLQCLTVFGGIGSFLALIFVCVNHRAESRDQNGKSSGTLGAILWIFAGILLIAAVGYQGNQYSTFKMSLNALSKMPEVSNTLKMTVHFPWAVAMTGIGALFAILDGLILSIKLCNSGSGDQGVSKWNRFTNQAV